MRRQFQAKECTTDAPLPGPTRRVAVVVLKRPVAMSPRSVSRSYINHTVKARDVRSTGRHGRIELVSSEADQCQSGYVLHVHSLASRASNGDARPDNRLALLDQAFFAGHRAAGQNEVVQCVWVYEHAVDFDGLRRFHHNLGYGLLGRRIERSPLPFGRCRWVSDRGPSHIDIAECARPRAELSDWVDERSQLPTDAEWGPGWHLGVLPLTDGSTAVSLVASHYVVDVLGFAVALADAVLGNARDLGYPPPRSRTRTARGGTGCPPNSAGRTCRLPGR